MKKPARSSPGRRKRPRQLQLAGRELRNSSSRRKASAVPAAPGIAWLARSCGPNVRVAPEPPTIKDMALIYDAVLRPSKTDLISKWAPAQPWFVGDALVVPVVVASFRFDDPADEVGVETHLVRFGTGPLLQIALTYRGAPLPGGEAWLIGTMSHSVLGDRWIYDATGDPVYLATVAAAALTGGQHADQFLYGEHELTPLTLTATVRGSGASRPAVPDVAGSIVSTWHEGSTVVTTGTLRVGVVRVLDDSAPRTTTADTAFLTGIWAGQTQPQLLVTVRLTT